MTVKSSISLSNDHYAFARAQVEDGRFASVSAVVQHGLDLLRQKAEDERLERDALRALLEERQRGRFVGADQMRARVMAMVAARQDDPGKIMTWRLEYAAEAENDFALILDHLIQSYMSFGDSAAEATSRAGQRLAQILDDAERIATAPYRGQQHPDILPGLRQLTFGKASFWFTVDETATLIRVFAVFFGSQDQHRRMLLRLLDPGDGG